MASKKSHFRPNLTNNHITFAIFLVHSRKEFRVRVSEGSRKPTLEKIFGNFFLVKFRCFTKIFVYRNFCPDCNRRALLLSWICGLSWPWFHDWVAGGVAGLKALGGPLPQMRFCPTGGITAANASGYLALANVMCVGGSWVAPPAMVAAGDWAGITRLAAAAVGLRAA